MLCVANIHMSRSSLATRKWWPDLTKKRSKRFLPTAFKLSAEYSPMRASLIAISLRSVAKICTGILFILLDWSSTISMAIVKASSPLEHAGTQILSTSFLALLFKRDGSNVVFKYWKVSASLKKFVILIRRSLYSNWISVFFFNKNAAYACMFLMPHCIILCRIRRLTVAIL